MTRDNIIRMAREAATEDGSVARTDGKNIVIYAAKTRLFLERFAALVAAAEREACAKVCEDIPLPKNAPALTHLPTIERCIAAIRARGDK